MVDNTRKISRSNKDKMGEVSMKLKAELRVTKHDDNLSGNFLRNYRSSERDETRQSGLFGGDLFLVP